MIRTVFFIHKGGNMFLVLVIFIIKNGASKIVGYKLYLLNNNYYWVILFPENFKVTALNKIHSINCT